LDAQLSRISAAAVDADCHAGREELNGFILIDFPVQLKTETLLNKSALCQSMLPRMHFSKTEIKHLIIAWLVISLAFGIVINDSRFSITLLRSIILAALSVGVGFLVHELSHKAVAQHYHCLAEFRANFQMLFLAVFMSFFGFVFAAPGAVMIFGYITRKQNGLISLAGPLSNLLLAVLFLPVYFLTTEGIIHQIAQYGFWINSFLALFNMIPFGMFDGSKIIKWNKWVFTGMVAVSGVFTFIAFLPMFR